VRGLGGTDRLFSGNFAFFSWTLDTVWEGRFAGFHFLVHPFLSHFFFAPTGLDFSNPPGPPLRRYTLPRTTASRCPFGHPVIRTYVALRQCVRGVQPDFPPPFLYSCTLVPPTPPLFYGEVFSSPPILPLNHFFLLQPIIRLLWSPLVAPS